MADFVRKLMSDHFLSYQKLVAVLSVFVSIQIRLNNILYFL